MHDVVGNPKWVTTKTAAALTGYTATYIRRLAGRGDVAAVKIGRDWLVERDALLAYQAHMEALGPQRHSGWRADLAAKGRGRRRQGGAR